MLLKRLLFATSLLGLGYAGTAILHPMSAAASDDPKAAAPSAKIEPWKAEDIIFAERAAQFRISPDNKWVVWVKSAGDKDKDATISNLVLSSMTATFGATREIPLTRGGDSVSQPRWSPDGEWIAFLSTKDRAHPNPDAAKMQIWLINAHGGEAWPITELARSPREIQWLDKDSLIYSAEEDPTLYDQEAKKKKDDSEVVEDDNHAAPVRMYKVGVKDKKITRLTGNTDWIENWGVSRDGRYVAASHAKSLRYAFDQKTPPIIVLHDLTNNAEKTIFTEGRFRAGSFDWAPDNSGFYLTTPYSTDKRFMVATITQVYFYDVKSASATQVNLDWPNGLGFDLQAVPGGFVAALAAGSHDDMARYTKNGGGWTRTTLSGEHAKNIESFAISEDGKNIAYSASTASKLPQPFRAQVDGDKISAPEQLTTLNSGLVTGRAYAKSEVIRWKGSLGEQVEGILYYPTNYDSSKKYPLITAIHGGPLGADRDLWGESWAYPIQLFAQRGAFVLRPNYHGSNNYGLPWAESICCGKYYDLETPDINAGVDYLIAQGKADPDRIGTMGWSNGSILSTSLITTYPERYKVASVGAGDVEWISDWANVDFGQSFDSYYFGKSPLEDPELYLKKSPIFKMDKVQAPVLIFHGSADRNVPPAQSWTYFRTLQYYGKPVKYIVFPGEPHGPRKLTHQVRKVDEEMAWFDKYFFKTAKPENEAVKKDSPLELMLRTNGILSVRGDYGMELKAKNKSVVTPEVVKRNSLEIGRFEVTRAQYAACASKSKTERTHLGSDVTSIKDFDEVSQSLRHNAPATNVTIDDAKEYASCLSDISGQVWRIPYEDEVKELYINRDGENT
ncbi:MAG TPA: prolyl oligopeptidase family serine peptidase, partial [Candidatus Dormibacteraeota bacterium]|nr:prolyl oligopeptidase family serine peptidase [Candidatus Dormibacteraeota bacterium]